MKYKQITKFKQFLEKILSSKYFPGILLIIAALLIIYQPASNFLEIDYRANTGKMLLHAIKNETITYRMPFIGLLSAIIEYHLKINPQNLLKIISTFTIVSTYILSYIIGLNSKCRITALFTLLITVIFTTLQSGKDFEQTIYSFLILLAAELILLRNKSYNIKTSIVAGLAIGFTFFVRSPLFLFPVLILIFDFFYHSKNLKKYIINSIIFLSAAYIILLPWIKVNHFLFNKFIPFEKGRATCNIITSIKGTTFTAEINARSLAGITNEESVYKWAAKELKKDPIPFISAIPKRLLQVFYMYPFLILLGLIGLIIGRKDKNVLLISLIAGYFISIHCLLSIEERYFYPLKYLLAFPAAYVLCFLFAKKEKSSTLRALPHAFFYATLAIIIMMEVVIIVYPFRAKQGVLAFNNALRKFPNDRWLLKKKGEFLLFHQNTHEEGIQLLETAYKTNPDGEIALGYFLNTLKAKNINEISNPPNHHDMAKIFAIKMFKELQLDEINAAKKTFIIISDIWKDKITLRNPTSTKDFEILKEIKRHHKLFWNIRIYKALYWWPIQKRIKIISNLAKITPNTYISLKESWYLATNNEPEKAKKLLKYAQKTNNKTADEKLEICLIFQQLGEYKEALLILDNLITNDINNFNLYNGRGVVLRFLNKNDLAIKDFQKALKINPLFYQAELNLGSLYVLSNNKILATKHYSNIANRKNLPLEIIKLAKKELSKI